MTILGGVAAALGFFVAGAASLPPENQLPPIILLVLGSIGAALSFILGYTNKGNSPTVSAIKGFILILGLGVFLSSNPVKAQTETPTDTPVPTATETPTETPVPTATNTTVPTATFTLTRTPTITPTVTQTPDPFSRQSQSHVHVLEMTLLKGDADLPHYSDACVASSYNPSIQDMCRCEIYFMRVGGTISLNARCPDGTTKQITTIP